MGDVMQGICDRLLKTPSENVSFVTWGNHMATNEYVHVSNVVLAGTLFYRTSFYDALKRLASGRSAQAGEVTKEELEKTMDGESMHQILQALCRGSVRKSDGVGCHPCNAYVIASVRSRIPQLIERIFPGCRQEDWRPIERTLRGHVKAAIEYIGERLQAEGSMLPFTQVAKALGMTARDFANDVPKHDDFRDALAELGVVEYSTSGVRFNRFLLPFAPET